jgi:hypothetical protein
MSLSEVSISTMRDALENFSESLQSISLDALTVLNDENAYPIKLPALKYIDLSLGDRLIREDSGNLLKFFLFASNTEVSHSNTHRLSICTLSRAVHIEMLSRRCADGDMVATTVYYSCSILSNIHYVPIGFNAGYIPLFDQKFNRLPAYSVR